MKKIIKLNITLLFCILVSGTISNYYISSIFLNSEKKMILFSSNISLLFSSLFAILIYLVVFWMLWNFIKKIGIEISHEKFYEIVSIVYKFFIFLELSKIIFTFVFLRNEIAYLIPDESLKNTLKTTDWFYFIKMINFSEIFFLPLVLFIALRENKTVLKHSVILSVIFMTTIFLIGL